MMSLRDKDTKQETGNSTKAASSISRQWSAGIKNPRIVRVSRTFGGKDRHSKVCTVKGLRDRRIRLSVPTAIQLYDLQDRLGLSQPSKVIDWLLDTTKNDIDKLPPLPNIPGGFAPFHHGGCGPQSSSSSTPFLDANLIPLRKQCININSHVDEEDHDQQSLLAKFKYWDSNSMINMRSSKQKEVDHDHQGGMGELSNSTTNSQVLAQNFFPIARGNIINTSVVPPPPTLLSSNPMLNYYHWEPNSNLSLTQLGSHGLPSQNHDHHSNSSTLPSSLSLSSGSQLFLYPSMSTTSMFPPPPHASNFMNTHHQIIENELRQYNNRSFNLSNPISSSDLHNSSSLGLNHNQPHLHQNQDEGDHRRS